MDDDARLQAVELALSQAKRVEREARLLKRSLAQLRDDYDEQTPTAEEAHGHGNENDND